MPKSSENLNIALISMPWSLFNRPSIQLGALKAYVETHSQVRVDCFHPYLSLAKTIGTETYTGLSKNSWAGEALYSALLFPAHKASAQRLFIKRCKGNVELAGKFTELTHHLQDHLSKWVGQTDFSTYNLTGFTVCFNQLCSSLAAAAEIKEKFPQTQIVFGGSSCVGSMGTSLVETFDQVDYVIAGEGEQQLLDLCHIVPRALNTKAPETNDQENFGDAGLQDSLGVSTLPVPDYQPYFDELQNVFPARPFNPVIPLEFSRGCWWRKCTFCNLNLQWHNYRSKPAENMIAELKELHGKHQCLDFTFCDNALPQKEAAKFFTFTGNWDVDFSFFAEIRAIDDQQTLALYNHGGLKGVQVGIESLANSLLEKMAKGTHVIDNFAVLKHCAEHGVTLDGNLIVEFPGSSREEAEETIANLDYALPFHPLSAATFFLGTGSTIAEKPWNYTIQAVTEHAHYRNLFPEPIRKKLNLLIKDYRGDKMQQRKRWQAVRRKIKQWQNFHNDRRNTKTPALSYRDGGNFLIIRQERINGKPLLHRLQGTSRKLYIYCDAIRNLNEIKQQFPQLEEKSILNFFDDLSKKYLLFQEQQKYLALAIRVHK